MFLHLSDFLNLKELFCHFFRNKLSMKQTKLIMSYLMNS